VGTYVRFYGVRNLAIRVWNPLYALAHAMQQITDESFARAQAFSAD
jgi:hypothetical protein